jgi:PAS domain S-box-containing protein
VTVRPSADELERLSRELSRVEARSVPPPPHTRARGTDTIGVASLAKALHVSRSSIMVTDARLDLPGPTIRYVNPAFEQLTGYSIAETVGHDPRFLQGPATDRTVLDRLRADLAEHGTFEGQTINYRKDGTAFVMSWRISAVRRPDGSHEAYVAVQDDITESWLDKLRATEAVTALQRTLLATTTDTVAGLDVATLYRPADDHSHVGGDWFDVVEVDGVAHLVVGDVAGHGVPAAADMGKLRFALSCLLRAGLDPEDAMTTVRAALQREHQQFATVAIATIDARRELLTVRTHGHPAVLHAGGDGARALRSRHPMIGVDPEGPIDAVTTHVAPGDLVVLFTDGLVETRRTTVIDGTADALAFLGSMALAADVEVGVVADRLVEHSLGSTPPSDDVAVLVARIAPAAPTD